MIRRGVFWESGSFDSRLRYLEDYYFGIQLLASGHETHFLAKPMLIYHRGSRNQERAHLKKMIRTEILILNLHADLVRKKFGQRGLIRLKARCCKKHGLCMGRSKGRSTWGGVAELEALLCRVHAVGDA